MDSMSWGPEPCSPPSAALTMCDSLLPGERPEGAPPGLTLSPVPGILRLGGHSAAREDSALQILCRRIKCSYSISSRTLTSSALDVGNTRRRIALKGQSPAPVSEVIQEPQDLTIDLIW